ncbi:hypothetical protein [Kitasatospora purpeofusca]|uniref:hypothetical protein n=1 Tax=Kitasatospora purpeofusca TaxID=67352 RepID=UPI0022561700|nr:hypothetical protein [Kitasatospora purpeofusca]MCX4690721.1 hypothetical protein [Kitasatospora purpeofusca]
MTVALAQGSRCPARRLTQRHLDLKNDFYEEVRARGQVPDSEARLRRQVVKLKELRARDKELRQLSADRQGLGQVVNQLVLENSPSPRDGSTLCPLWPVPTSG